MFHSTLLIQHSFQLLKMLILFAFLYTLSKKNAWLLQYLDVFLQFKR